jgi:hypothetical protein
MVAGAVEGLLMVREIIMPEVLSMAAVGVLVMPKVVRL